MAGILSSYSDSTCNTHNALRNISGYACGVTFEYKTTADAPDMRYAVVSLQECCAAAAGSSPVLRIPGNAGCEMQFCVVPPVAATHTWSYVHHQQQTTTTTAAAAAAAAVSTEVVLGPSEELISCLGFVHERDLPDGVGDRVARAGNWCVARMYDTELPASEVEVAVTASAAPASWTAAAVSSASAAATSAAASNSAGSSRGRYDARRTELGMKAWAVAAVMTIGLAIAL